MQEDTAEFSRDLQVQIGTQYVRAASNSEDFTFGPATQLVL